MTSPSVRPPALDVGLLAVAIVAVSTSAPLAVAMAVPALAIAFWRTALASGVIGAYVALRPDSRRGLRAYGRSDLALTVLAGAFLAAHFGTWIPSLRLTSVASSVALVCLQPVWVVLWLRLRGEAVAGRTWTGVAVAFVGVLVLTGIDAGLGADVLLGDALALVGGIVVAGYTIAGARVRQRVPTAPYTLVCYSLCAAMLLVVCLAAGTDLGGYDPRDWALLVLLTLLAQLLGHSLIILVLRSTSPTLVSLAILLEVPGAIIVTAVALGQLPPWEVLPAVALMLGGIALVVSSAGPAAAAPEPPG